jgi:hypothetical protein
MSYGHVDKIARRAGAPAADEGKYTPAIDPALYERDDVRRVLAVRDIGALYRALNDAGVNQREIATLPASPSPRCPRSSQAAGWCPTTCWCASPRGWAFPGSTWGSATATPPPTVEMR